MSQRFFRIHPSIGVARVGDSPTEFFIGPERPNEPPNYDTAQKKFRPFKDSQGRVKRQAARFRVFEYALQGGRLVPVREVTAGSQGITQITWKAHLANRKAAFFKFDGQDGADGQWKGQETEPGVHDTANRLRNSHVPAADRERLLVIDPGAKSISGRNTPPVPFTNTKSHIPIKSLGELRTDENGHLLVLGGHGEANTTKPGTLINNYVNNDHWFDDMADGPVSAEVTYVVNGVAQVAKLEGDTGAWVLVGPPDFAPSVGITVRLLDTLWDVAVRFPQQVKLVDTDGLFSQGLFARLATQRADWDALGNTFKSYKPSFLHEVYPLLERALRQRQVHNPEASKSFHGSLAGVEQDLGSLASTRGRRMRRTIFGYMRNPSNNAGNDPLLMPKGLGDKYSDLEKQPGPDYFMSLTRVQYAVLERWAAGEFVEDWDPVAAQAIAQALTAEGLDRAAMENSVGGPFFPGIDCGWMVRRPELYGTPFRVKHSGTVFPGAPDTLPIRPGFFSQQMALPWQADFYQCKKQLYPPAHVPYEGERMYHMWWCAHRPDDVFATKGDLAMVSWTRELEKVAEVEAQKPGLQSQATEDAPAKDLAMYIQMQQKWSSLGFVLQEGEHFFESQERST